MSGCASQGNKNAATTVVSIDRSIKVMGLNRPGDVAAVASNESPSALPELTQKSNRDLSLVRLVSHSLDRADDSDETENETRTSETGQGSDSGQSKAMSAANQPAEETRVHRKFRSEMGMTLEEFESRAFANNPTIRQLEATSRKAAGYREQVGYRSNPTFGYQGVQIADEGTDQHTLFLEKEFVTGGKLDLSRRVLDRAVHTQNLELETQRQRLATDVRVKFYRAFAAQERIKLASEFQRVLEHGFELAELRLDAGEGSKLEVLQARVQKSKVDLARRKAVAGFNAAWQELAAVVGDSSLAPSQLKGSLDFAAAELDWDQLKYGLVISSPERAAALARVEHARAKLNRQKVQSIPNLTAQLAAGFDNATDSGMLNLQVGAPLMIHNRNQGNVTAAQAEYCRAVAEVQRIEQAIHSRLGTASGEYEAAAASTLLFESEILPAALESLELADLSYEAGESSFIEVLIVRRVFIESQLEYLQAKSDLIQAKSRVEGFLLTGGLDPINEVDTGDSSREQAFSQQ